MPSNSCLTDYDNEYPSCLETRCELRVYPGNMHPDEVTRLLNIEPTQVNEAGKIIVNSLGRRRVVRNNGWFLSSEGSVDSKDLRRHLDWLLAKLHPSASALAYLQNMPGVTMTIDCVWWSASGHGGPTLWPEQMKIMAELGLECGFDVYFEKAFSEIMTGETETDKDNKKC